MSVLSGIAPEWLDGMVWVIGGVLGLRLLVQRVAKMRRSGGEIARRKLEWFK